MSGQYLSSSKIYKTGRKKSTKEEQVPKSTFLYPALITCMITFINLKFLLIYQLLSQIIMMVKLHDVGSIILYDEILYNINLLLLPIHSSREETPEIMKNKFD
jgi:hypothetical protein